MTIPSALVPRVPSAASPMTMNLRCDATFVEDAGWHAACRDMKNLSKNIGKRKYCFSNSASAATRPASLNILFGGSPPKTQTGVLRLRQSGKRLCARGDRGRALCLRADIGEVISSIQRGQG